MRSLLIATGCLIAACSDPAPVVTPVRFMLNPGDGEAAAALAAIELEVYPASSACSELQAWHASVCGQAACTDPPAPSAASRARTRLMRADGAWRALELHLSDPGPWDVLARGLDADGNAFLHGCRTISSRVPMTLRLWRPSCGTLPACADVDPLCEEVLDCAAIVAETDTTYPPCTASSMCRECVPGALTACGGLDAGLDPHCEAQLCAADGHLEACGGQATAADVCDAEGLDEDCDGEAFGAEADAHCRVRRGDPDRPLGNRCDPGRRGCVCDDGSGGLEECGDDQACCATGAGDHCVSTRDDAAHCGGCGRACGPGERCADGQCLDADGGVATCVPDGAERCNGRDDDCRMGIDDGAAEAACEPLGSGDPPLTDHCRGLAGCGCGEGPPCNAIESGRRQRCCAGACVADTGGCDAI